MQAVAHIVALLIAWIVWHAIGGFPGLIVAVLAFGLIELVVLVLIGLVTAPFRKDDSTPSSKPTETDASKDSEDSK